MEEMRILAPTGVYGSGFLEESFGKALRGSRTSSAAMPDRPIPVRATSAPGSPRSRATR